jgi:hypothetical protein
VAFAITLWPFGLDVARGRARRSLIVPASVAIGPMMSRLSGKLPGTVLL